MLALDVECDIQTKVDTAAPSKTITSLIMKKNKTKKTKPNSTFKNSIQCVSLKISNLLLLILNYYQDETTGMKYCKETSSCNRKK